MSDSPYRAISGTPASSGSPVGSLPEKVEIRDTGMLAVAYEPTGDGSRPRATVQAELKDGVMTEPTMFILGTVVGTREKWEEAKAIGDRAWAEFDLAVRRRSERIRSR